MDRYPEGPMFCKNCPDVYKCGAGECVALKAIVDAWLAWPAECYEMSPDFSDAMETAIKIKGAR